MYLINLIDILLLPVDDKPIYQFDGNIFNSTEGEIYNKHTRVKLKPLHSKLLQFFITHPDAPYSIESLKEEVWQQQFLSDSAVKKAISELRKELDSLKDNQIEYIKTVPQQGYLFNCKSLSTYKRRRWTILMALSLLFSAFILIFAFISNDKIKQITLVEQVTDNSNPAYTQLIRSTLFNILSQHYDIRMLYSAEQEGELQLDYGVIDNQLSITLTSENQDVIWEKRAKIQNNIHGLSQTIVKELSQILAIPIQPAAFSFIDNSPAYELFIKGKITYYQVGSNNGQAELFFEKSLQLQPDNNPSSAALLDIYGLQERTTKLDLRNDALLAKINRHITMLETATPQNANNLAALAKYQIVNRGDPKKALSYLDGATQDLSNVYDLHVLALVYALNGNISKSEELNNLAEQRFPQRNAVLWNKALVHLINENFEAAMQQSKWAQQIEPHWYPLVYITPRLLRNQHEAVLDHLKTFPNPLFQNLPHDVGDLSAYAKIMFEQIEFLEFKPFEAEIAYLLARYYKDDSAAKTVSTYIQQNFPEKSMMLSVIDAWLIRQIAN